MVLQRDRREEGRESPIANARVCLKHQSLPHPRIRARRRILDSSGPVMSRQMILN
jgi:hypothetical protein